MQQSFTDTLLNYCVKLFNDIENNYCYILECHDHMLRIAGNPAKSQN